MATKNSCTGYVSTVVDIHFPEEKGVCCYLCPLMETYSRKQCRRTGEYLYDGQIRGHLCPLIIKEEYVGDLENNPWV